MESTWWEFPWRRTALTWNSWKNPAEAAQGAVSLSHPNFQNPLENHVFEKRKGCCQLAKKYGVLIFEDDPYGDLRFAGEALPSIKSMDTEGLVIYARTFSKILSAGIRVGYMALPKDVFNKFVVAKQCVDVHTGMLSQLLCYRFLTQYNLQEHIQAIGKIYRRKCQVMLDALDKIPSDKLRYTRPQGGLFVGAPCPMLRQQRVLP